MSDPREPNDTGAGVLDLDYAEELWTMGGNPYALIKYHGKAISLYNSKGHWPLDPSIHEKCFRGTAHASKRASDYH